MPEPVPLPDAALDLAARVGACLFYAQRLNEIEAVPTADDFNEVIVLLQGGEFVDPSALAR